MHPNKRLANIDLGMQGIGGNAWKWCALAAAFQRSLHSDSTIVLLVTLNPACTATQLSLHAIDFAQRASCLRERHPKKGEDAGKQFLLRQQELLRQ